MRSLIPYFLIVVACCLSASLATAQHHTQQAGPVFIDNDYIRIGFSPDDGHITRFEDKTNAVNFVNPDREGAALWQFEFPGSGKIEKISASSRFRFSYDGHTTDSITLVWQSDADGDLPSLKVTASVKLAAGESLSYWRIHVDGLEGLTLSNIIYPQIALREFGKEQMAVPHWMGMLMKNPRAYLQQLPAKVKRYSWDYPNHLTMQFVSLYDPDRSGFYAACNDTTATMKTMAFVLNDESDLVYQAHHYPAVAVGQVSYAPAYDVILGAFKGDWFSYAAHYREWGTRQQWARNSRLHKQEIPSWLPETALWIWNRGRSDSVLTPAVSMRERLGLPVNVLWHWWHGGGYDDTFPDYFPPREGALSFKENLDAAHEKGVRALLYMNVLQWGNAAESWEREGAAAFTIKDVLGRTNTRMYNIFTRNTLTNMCVATDFWKSKYAGLADTALNVYGAGGIYMDQACLGRICYDRAHWHPTGGGNYWVDHFGKLTERIRVASKQLPMLAGEGAGEAWLPHLDAFLTLQVSHERYAGIGGWEPIPFFQAVYHPYGIVYGNYSSLLTPPYDELWPEETAPKETLQLLDAGFNTQFLMEQARSFVWGMQPMLANYRSHLHTTRKAEMDFLESMVRLRVQGLPYFLYGKMLREPALQRVPQAPVKVSKLSIYAGQMEKVTAFEKMYPLVYTAAWLADDGQIALPLVNIMERPHKITFRLDTNHYPIGRSGTIYLVDGNGKQKLQSYTGMNVQVSLDLPSRYVCYLEIVPDGEDSFIRTSQIR